MFQSPWWSSTIMLPLSFIMVTTILLPTGVNGWGTIGHEMVGNIAYDRLTNQTRQAILKILDNYTSPDSIDEAGTPLGAIADWADRVRFHYHW